MSKPKVDDRAARKAERQRERTRLKEEAAQARKNERRHKAIAKAQAALEKGQWEHHIRTSTIEAERERRSQAEDARWQKQKAKLEAALCRARD